MWIFGLPAPLMVLLMSCASGIAAPRNWTPGEIIHTEISNEKPPVPPTPPPLPPPRPLVIWHGLGKCSTLSLYNPLTYKRQGDQYASAGMLDFIELIKEMHEGIYIYSARISDEPGADQKAGWVRLLTLYSCQHAERGGHSLEM